VLEAQPLSNQNLRTSDVSQTTVQAKVSKKDTSLATVLDKQSMAPKGPIPEKDGIYLYGQSSVPEQIGQEYMVFELRQDKVVGAFYMPQSEFSCFQGSLHLGQLALTIASTPDTEAYPDRLANQNTQQVATASDKPSLVNTSISYPYSVALSNYHQLSSLSDNDKRLLETCKASYR
jgi:hypothetical protein